MSKKPSGGEEAETKYVTTAVPSTLLDEWDKEVEEEGWPSRSQYIRAHTESGRKELAKLHPKDSPRDNSIEQEILDKVPEETEVQTSSATEAPDRDELVEAVLDPIRKQILEELDALQSADQIQNKAVHGGYVKNE